MHIVDCIKYVACVIVLLRLVRFVHKSTNNIFAKRVFREGLRENKLCLEVTRLSDLHQEKHLHR